MGSGWKNATVMHKIVSVIGILASIAVIVLSVLQMTGVWEQAINICIPLMGLTMLCQAYTQWNISRKVAYLSLGTAVFVFVCSIVVFFLRNTVL